MADGGAPSGATMVDAQLGIAHVFKPADGFEQIYQGVSTSIPIAIPTKIDPRAGTPGFDPNLMEGIAVPQGARVLLTIPMCFVSDPQDLSPFRFYSYDLIWRFNNLGDFRAPPAGERRKPYHIAKQSPGAPDTTLGPPGLPRVTIVSAWNVVAYEQPEPMTGEGSSNLRIERITPRIDEITSLLQPLLPNGQSGVVQQGVFDPATSGAQMPCFVQFWTDAGADELIVLARRTNLTSPSSTWDFTDPAADLAFSNVYGTGNGAHAILPGVGIYVQTGTNP
jgi:hypothetical protein